MMDRYNEYSSRMGFGMDWWWIVGFIVMVVIIVMVVKVISQSNNFKFRLGNKSALDILSERYARGEINKQEFEQRKKDLK